MLNTELLGIGSGRLEKYMSSPSDIAIESGQVGGDSVAVDRLTYDVGKEHWTAGGGVDMLVTGRVKFPRVKSLESSKEYWNTSWRS